jgi:protoporphyrinogen oxidase
VKPLGCPSSAGMDRVVILGAGLAGLSAAYILSKEKRPVIVVEKEAGPGGLCRTFEFKGYQFDIGPHIFFHRNDEIASMLYDLAPGMINPISPRRAFFYNGKFFSSVLDIVLTEFSTRECVRALLDLLAMRIFNRGPVLSCQDWLVKHYGSSIYSRLMKIHEVKFWGLAPSMIDQSWGTVNRAPKTVIGHIKAEVVKWLPNRFSPPRRHMLSYYPTRGARMIYEELEHRIASNAHSRFLFNSEVVSVNHRDGRISSIEILNGHTGTVRSVVGETFISTIPVVELLRKLVPQPPSEIHQLEGILSYRHLVVANVLVDLARPFPCQWAEIYSPEVKAGRITNFAELSRGMGCAGDQAPMCLEYYCFEDEDVWGMSDDGILALADSDLRVMGLVHPGAACEGFVRRLRCAYPMYLVGFHSVAAQLMTYLGGFKNLQSISRGGIYRYNNMGHSIESGLRAAENLLGKNHALGDLNVVDAIKEHSGGSI